MILQVPFVKISVKDRVQDLLDRFFVEAAVQDPFVRLFAQAVYGDLYARFLYDIFK